MTIIKQFADKHQIIQNLKGYKIQKKAFIEAIL